MNNERAELIDRSDAVNLARNMLEIHDCKGITEKGVRVLCDAVMRMDAALLAADAQPPRVTPEMLDALRNDIATLRDIQMHSDERAVRLGLAADAQGGEAETFEQWNAKQHGDPEEIGFLQALRVAYCAGQDSVYRARPQPQAVAQEAQPEHVPVGTAAEKDAHLFLVADRAKWLADNFNVTQEHFDEAIAKLRDYANLINEVRDFLLSASPAAPAQPQATEGKKPDLFEAMNLDAVPNFPEVKK